MQPEDGRKDIATPLNAEEVKKRIAATAESLIQSDRYLFVNDLNERSITHKFAEQLQRVFSDWHVDCEYNRDGHDPKRLNLPPRRDISNDDLNAKTVFPDIIIHHRGTTDNLAVIEVKKSTNHENDEWDVAKLSAFRQQLGYRVTLFIRFATGGEDVRFDVSHF